jgi:hypothetical protein
MQKICSRCKLSKTVDNFHKRKDRKSGLCSFCKECAKERIKTYIQNNYNIYIQRQKKHAKNRLEKYAKILTEHKNKSCTDCGKKYNRHIMHFNHLPGTKKNFSLRNAKEHT